MDSLISSYVDLLQILPLEMQSKITGYLQTDLQHRHLLTLAKQSLNDLQKATDTDAKQNHLSRIICLLAAIQNICDRRINDLDELDEVIETHSLRLMNAEMKVDTIGPQIIASNTEDVLESEADISDQETSDHQCNMNPSRRNFIQEPTSDKCSPNSLSNARCNDINLRGKGRFPLRAVSTNSRTASRRSLNKWVSGVHRFKPVNSVVNSNANLLKSHNNSNHKSTNRTPIDLKQHKVGVTYGRYPRTQQQRFKSRVLSRPLHSNRTRPPQYLEYAMLRHGSRKRKVAVSKCTHSDTPHSCNEARYMGAVRRRCEHDHPSFYPNNSCFNSPVKSVSELNNEEGKVEERDAYTLLSLKSPRRLGERSSDWNNNYSENENSEDGDEIGHSAYGVDSDQNCSQEQQNIRTPANQLSIVQNGDTGRQKMYRLRRGLNNTTQSSHSHRANSIAPSLSPEHSINRGSLSSQNHPQGNTRRGCRANNVARHKMDSQMNTRSPPGSPFRYSTHTDDVNLFRHKINSVSTPNRSISEASASPDERLYCICKKVSFGDMIACDNKFCEVEWFHFSCVDVRVQPKGKWYCPYCRGESSRIKRTDV
ncbi:unnamed protein product [Trichobilharzia szidati]|nr:unnamed protein product [Trichobilharzia szidati]